MYIFLNRTATNIGDHLYYSNSIKLINRIKPNTKILEVNAWKPLMEQIDINTLKKSKGIIIPGGPALRKDLFPLIYSLPSIVFKNKIPVIFLGIGSKIFPGTFKKLEKLKLGIFSFTGDEGCVIVFTEILNDYIFKWKDLVEFRHEERYRRRMSSGTLTCLLWKEPCPVRGK